MANNYITNDTWYILGSGASAAQYLDRGLWPILSVNCAVIHPGTTATTTVDRHFATKNYPDQWKALGPNAHVLFKLKMPNLLPDATFWDTCDPAIPEKGKVARCGRSSGLTAISLAVMGLGAKTVYLLGYDMEEANQNWQGLQGQPKRTHREQLIVDFEKWFKVFQSWGVEIYNTNPQTCLVGCPIKEL